MIARRRQRGITSLARAPRAGHARQASCPDHGCYTTIVSFASGLICPMRAFAPMLRVGVGMTIGPA